MYIMEDKNKQQQLSIELPEENAMGEYANLAIITHSSSEFVVDYIRVMPGMPKAKVISRIILTPEHAKRMLKALADNVNKYEETFGKIKNAESIMGFPINFGGPTAEA